MRVQIGPEVDRERHSFSMRNSLTRTVFPIFLGLLPGAKLGLDDAEGPQIALFRVAVGVAADHLVAVTAAHPMPRSLSGEC
ncbi:hypothetical protein [Nonomuraea africana]|uniref:hypothetical protein n=1 Tax=Nonomuraea africana TaxID=46171 RepID=UPI0033D29E49